MRIIHGYDFHPEEVAEYRETIYKNIIMGMKVRVHIVVKTGVAARHKTRQIGGLLIPPNYPKKLSNLPSDYQ